MKYLRSGNFHCKNISMVCVNHKKQQQKTTGNIFYNHYSQHIIIESFTAQIQHTISLETASSSMSAGTDGKHVTTFSVYNRSHILTATVHLYAIPQFCFTSKSQTQQALHSPRFLGVVVSFHITKQFSRVSWTTKKSL